MFRFLGNASSYIIKLSWDYIVVTGLEVVIQAVFCFAFKLRNTISSSSPGENSLFGSGFYGITSH